MSKIKIAQVITRLDWGGAPDIYRILADNLYPGAFDVTLVTGPTQYPTKKTADFLTKFSGKLHIVPALKREIDPVSDIRALIGLWRLFSIGKFDIVHTHTAKAGALGRIAAKLAGTGVVVHTPHGHNLYGYFDAGMTGKVVAAEKFLSRRTDMIIALTELEKSDYLKTGIAPEGKIEVIYQGLELDKYTRDRKDIAALKRSFNIDMDDNVVGMIGRLETVKGPEFFVDMASHLSEKHPRTKFIITGEGSLRGELEERARRSGLSGSVIFTGWRDDIPEILSILDILVMPSLNEAVGMSIIEAQAEGVPVVATRVGGIPEVVRDKVTGLLVAPSDSKALAEAVSALLSDNDRRAEMALMGKSWVRGKFTASQMVTKTSDLYADLFNRRKYGLSR